ncbi:SRPBCC family protein [Saccharothrix stipae]
MAEHGFTTTFTVEQTAAEVYDAVTDVRSWWSEDIEGATDRPGAEFDYHYQDLHRTRIRVTDAVPGRKVAWLVLENHFSFVQDQAEWEGTAVTFDITERDGRTELRFTHHGLVPDFECFDVCANAWSFYVGSSLRGRITTGEGAPNSGDRNGVPAPAAAVTR